MFLSRIHLNTELRKTQLAFQSPNLFHGAVESSFVNKQERNLWRIDKYMNQYYLLLLSEEKPNLENIINQFGYNGEYGEIKEYDGLLNRLENGQIWRFRLVANPTCALKQEGRKSKIVAHTSVGHQLEWLEKKAEKNGFIVRQSNVIASDWKIFKKKNNSAKVRLKESTFEGILEINDVELFKKAMLKGIGRGKVYGMGLLTIVRL